MTTHELTAAAAAYGRNQTTIETRNLRVYPAAQSQTAVAYPEGGPRYGVTVATHTYSDGPGAWKRWLLGRPVTADESQLSDADLAAIADAPRHYLCG